MGLFSRKSNDTIESLCHTIVLGGEAGEGIKSAGRILANTLLSSGFEVYLYDEYPSLIRGGHNAVFLSYSPYPVYSINREIDILVCFDRKTFDLHKGDLNTGSIIIYDREEIPFTDQEIKDYPCELIDLSINSIIKKNKYPHIIQNTLYLCGCLSAIGVEKKIALNIIKEFLGKKTELLKLNLEACEKIYSASEEYFGVKKYVSKSTFNPKPEEFFISGNEALGAGAIQGGLGFYAGYPMTPSSTILDFMFKNFRRKNVVVKQTEDEIAAINMAIGASFAGARAMVGTSGGGFSLMVEGLGLAAITETPLTVVISQRPGPATGLPTWTGQSDLLFALHASQDEFPRIILTPSDQQEAYEFGFQALNLTEKYQMPVIILLDKLISESYSKIISKPTINKKIDRGLMLSSRAISRLDNFKRYEFTTSGISARSIPGQLGGTYIANSDESDEYGFSDETSVNRIKRVQKRFTKLKAISKDLPELNVYGDIKAKLCLITWGSTKGAALEAVRRLQNANISVKLLSLNYVNPFPSEEVLKFLRSSKHVLLIEGNYTSQLGQLIRVNTGYDIPEILLKYDGRPIYPDEIVNKVLEIL